MVQLLESTKSYLKNSTRLGRRMSHYKDEMSSSETSLPPEKAPVPVPVVSAKHRSSTEKSPSRTSQRRLSGLFSLARSNSNSSSTRHSIPSPTDDRPSSGILPRKIGPDSEEKRRNSKSSDRTHATSSDKSSHSNSGVRRRSQRVSIAGDDNGRGSVGVGSSTEDDEQQHQHQHHHQQQQHQRGSQILDCDRRRRASRTQSQYDDVPRGRSPTWSMSNTISTATSSYHSRPSDYPSMKHYQAHVWRRQLLEDSIMHSLKLGYADRNRTVTRQRSRSLKSNARSRKVKEQAMLAAALGKDLPATSPSVSDHQEQGYHDGDIVTEEVTSRSMDVLKPLPQIKNNNNPYMTQTNASMLNITQSFASFTLELNENDVHRVMSSSVIPDLFRIKAHLGPGPGPGSRPRRNSKVAAKVNITTSPSTLPHAAPTKEGRAAPSMVSPTADWASSVFVSLEKHHEESPSAPNGKNLPDGPRDGSGVREAHPAVHVAAATVV
ncbi:hypothetical protein DFQ26_006836 [Actinomortierella ambigua]|nr:hypothetical protein DFQ26_006836 [Actinomortierella ambigua]